MKIEFSFFYAPWHFHPSMARGSPYIVQGMIRQQLSKHIKLPPLAHLLRIAALPVSHTNQMRVQATWVHVRDFPVLLAV